MNPNESFCQDFFGVIEVLFKPSEQNIGWDFIMPSTTQRSYLFSSKVHILKKKTRIFSFPWFFFLTVHYILWRTFVIRMQMKVYPECIVSRTECGRPHARNVSNNHLRLLTSANIHPQVQWNRSSADLDHPSVRHPSCGNTSFGGRDDARALGLLQHPRKSKMWQDGVCFLSTIRKIYIYTRSQWKSSFAVC